MRRTGVEVAFQDEAVNWGDVGYTLELANSPLKAGFVSFTVQTGGSAEEALHLLKADLVATDWVADTAAVAARQVAMERTCAPCARHQAIC